ncbi:hypothetical protein JQX13_44115 [Archangium violaceum]|uniref:hypothetical protein n=1 Tax=Archangium violaceum TaxID=83451 RepID=UPI00193BC2B6|nr:hypothetical protein [Archangium violaceum]QRK06977.1 hypothetical protein JQX13_44115 [Archangium violaceum]
MAGPFQERLVVSLTVTIGGTAHAIPPGNIKSFSLELRGWGHEGHVEFIIADNQGLGGQQQDTLLADFLKPDLAEVSLELKSLHTDLPAKPTPTSLTVKGLVHDKTLTELRATPAQGDPILYRRYGVSFRDAARLLWSQHFPCVLYTQKSFKDVLDAHKGDKISLTYDWSAVLDTTCPMIFLGLDPEKASSFYDLLLWYVDGHNGVLAYDYSTQGYELSATKDGTGTPLELKPQEVASLEVRFPEVIRHDMAVLNAVAEGPQNQAITQTSAVSGIRQDVLLRTAIADEVQARVDLETARLKVRGLELELEWNRFPAIAFTPGTLVKLPSTAGWNAAGVPASETFRVRHMLLRGDALQPGPDAERDQPDAGFHFQMRTRLERKDETWVELPEYIPPPYPRYVEGLIVSEVGEDADETWQAYTDEATSLDGYKVKIPLWEDQIITAPFNPNLLPGHYYFPAYKGEKVLVGLDFQRAWIKRFLDWRTGARMPQDGQGVHLLMGKTTQSNTSMKHYYDDARPVFLLKRTNDKDTGTLRIQEGNLFLQVKEDEG